MSASTPTPEAGQDERAMTDAESRVAPMWESWVMDQLEDDEISHCGHLDGGVIHPGCQHCDELTEHATHTMTAPVSACDGCSRWRNANQLLAERWNDDGLRLGATVHVRNGGSGVLVDVSGSEGHPTHATIRTGGRILGVDWWALDRAS